MCYVTTQANQVPEAWVVQRLHKLKIIVFCSVVPCSLVLTLVSHVGGGIYNTDIFYMTKEYSSASSGGRR